MRDSWLRPTPDLLSQLCRATRLFHLAIAVMGLILLGGGYLVELLHAGMESGLLQGLAVVLVYLMVFAGIGLAPLSLTAILVCRRDRELVILSILFWIFIGVLLWTEGHDLAVSAAFLVYAMTALLFFAARRKGKQSFLRT